MYAIKFYMDDKIERINWLECSTISWEYMNTIHAHIDKLVCKMSGNQIEIVCIAFYLGIFSVYNHIIYKSMWHVWKHYYSRNTFLYNNHTSQSNQFSLANGHAILFVPGL